MTNSPRQGLKAPGFNTMQKIALAGGALAMTAGPLTAGVAMAQAYGQDQGYGQGQPTYGQPAYGQPQGQPDGQYPGQYNNGQYQGQQYQGQQYQSQPYQGQPNGGDYPPPPPEPNAPSGYDGTRPPPPPPGYAPGPNDQQYAALDQQYAQNAESWARNNCVKSHGNVAGGAVVGGVLGALIGGALGGRHDRGAGVFAGAAVGAVGGAAVASASNGDTSPGCPPGFVVRGGAPGWGYQPQGYYYAAPTWYRPWVFIDNGWVYRPYPYHDFYYRRWHGGYGGRGPGRGPGWRR